MSGSGFVGICAFVSGVATLCYGLACSETETMVFGIIVGILGWLLYKI